MSTQIHYIIKTEYENRRNRAAELVEKKKNEIYEKIPQIRQLDSQVTSIALKYNRGILLGKISRASISELSSDIEKIKEQKNEIMIRNGFPPNYLEMDYICKNCKDTGFVELSNGGFDKCVCYKQQIIDFAYSKSNLNYLEKENFSKFDETKYNDEINEDIYKSSFSPRQNILGIKKKSIEFIENFENESKTGIIFTGRIGVGKTFMSNCIAKELIERGRTVLYLSSPQLFHIVKNYRTASWENQDNEDSNYGFIMDADLLIIDDLGIEAVTTSRYAELLTIINTRALNDSKKPCKTLISTNLSMTQIKEIYSERVASRLIGDYHIFKFLGEDIRVKK